ncbi:unnamed protein product [Mytilus coruscus]|uniref:Ig-like domain-containing protein n=1 Tax=Mytilus coruscus TaxID=42192 RepID=A0A6J8DIQ9_MYTCO|nr:unnamed protein product [Mytilus coruscus]
MSVLMKYLCIDMKTVLVFCILISDMYCEELFVKKYTTVDIACPFTPMSWYYDQSLTITVGRNVHPNFTTKYGISDNFNLTVFNFTYTDQGRYICKQIVDEEFKQHAVMVNLCNEPDEIKYVTYEPTKNCSVSERKLLCIDDKNTQYNAKINHVNHKAIINIVKLPTSKQYIDDRNESTPTERLIQYNCMTLNADNCLISDNTFQLNVEWISSNETTKEIATNDTQLYVYICKCNGSNTEEQLPCNETIQMYYSNKTLHLRDPEKYPTASFECVLVENDVFEKTTTSADIEIMRFVQVYKLIGISVACGMILVGVIIWGIRIALNKFKNNADNIARMNESQNCPAEGYSSIERRRRIEVGQMVSYKASRVSRSSIANESGHGLVYVPVESSNSSRSAKPEETNGNGYLQVPYLKNITSGKINTETPFLNYIEVEFNTDTVSPKFHIHGSGNGTPYADIDLTIKADPLPESDSSEEEYQ